MCSENCIQQFFFFFLFFSFTLHALQNQIHCEGRAGRVQRFKNHNIKWCWKENMSLSEREKKRDGHHCELRVMDTEWRRGLKAWIVSTRRWKTHIRSWETSLLHRQPEETLSIGCHGTRDRSWDHKSVVLVINLKIFLGLVSTYEDTIFFQHDKQVLTVKSVTVQNIVSGLQVTMFHPLKF